MHRVAYQLHLIILLFHFSIDPFTVNPSSSLLARGSAPKNVEIVVNNTEKPEEDEYSSKAGYFPSVSDLFSNPALSAGLQSGASAINRSIDALMESVFYGIMDNEINISMESAISIKLGLSRDVYSIPDGGYVILDRFNMGPDYGREIGSIDNYPVSLGAEGKVEIIDIYTRNDAQRISDDQNSSTLRYLVNNLFGLVPLLSAILPPSFNPNELYDPVRQFLTPIGFPATIEEFHRMPTNTIRSYGLNGVIRLPITIQAIKSDVLASAFNNTSNKLAVIPYTIFTGRSYRINVLKKDEKTAWVGLTSIREIGHGISTLVGSVLFAFSGIIPQLPLTGIETPIFPLDTEMIRKFLQQYDHLYEFDLSKPNAQLAYLAAVKGDFQAATELSRTKDSGVIFHFNRNKVAVADKNEQFNQLFVYNRSQFANIEKAKVKIKDSKGTFTVLEGSGQARSGSWNLLVGEQYKGDTQTVELFVEEDKDKEGKYVFKHGMDQPVGLTLAYDIKDMYANLSEYIEYISELELFSGIELHSIPKFDQHKTDRKQKWLNSNSRTRFDQLHTAINEPELAFGRFRARAVAFLSFAQIKKIADIPQKKLLLDLQKELINPIDPKINVSHDVRSRFIESIIYRATYNFINFFSFHSNLVTRLASTHRHIRNHPLVKQNIENPETLRDAIIDFFSSLTPLEMMGLIRKWLGKDTFPVTIQLHTKPINYLDPGIKKLYGSLNGRTFDNGIEFPQKSRYKIAKSKLSAFNPGELRDTRARLNISKVSLSNQAIGLLPELNIDLDVANIPKENDSIKVYIKVQQSGTVQFGKLVLIEQVIDLPLIQDDELGTASIDFFISGPKSYVKAFLLDQALVFGGTFRATISVGAEKLAWSDQLELEFNFEDGQLDKS